MADFQTTIAKHYNCNFPICTRNELALIQWGNSSITYNLPAAYFNDADRSFSIQGWNPTILGDKTPEIYAFSNYPIDFNITKQLLSYSIGGIFEYHERQNFISFVVENNQTSLQSRFNLNLTEARVLFDYMRSITIQYMFGGLFLSKTPYEFLWGYEDKYLIKMVN